MFFITHQERKVLLGVAVLILTGSLIKHFKAETAQDSTVIIPAEENAFILKTININIASAQKLREINGIGEVTARRIVEYRTRFGEFEGIDDLKKVKGIGEKKARIIGEYICFE